MKVSCLRVKSNLDAVVPKSELFQNLCGCLQEGMCGAQGERDDFLLCLSPMDAIV